MSQSPPIIYTWTDEAPALATHALLPVVRAFAGAHGCSGGDQGHLPGGDASWPSSRTTCRGQAGVRDDLAELGHLVEKPEANVIKLPNISASVPQLTAAIKELQSQGYPIPDYPAEPKSDEEREIRARYDRVKGSAVNPVLRQGNSDRRIPAR